MKKMVVRDERKNKTEEWKLGKSVTKGGIGEEEREEDRRMGEGSKTHQMTMTAEKGEKTAVTSRLTKRAGRASSSATSKA